MTGLLSRASCHAPTAKIAAATAATVKPHRGTRQHNSLLTFLLPLARPRLEVRDPHVDAQVCPWSCAGHHSLPLGRVMGESVSRPADRTRRATSQQELPCRGEARQQVGGTMFRCLAGGDTSAGPRLINRNWESAAAIPTMSSSSLPPFLIGAEASGGVLPVISPDTEGPKGSPLGRHSMEKPIGA